MLQNVIFFTKTPKIKAMIINGKEFLTIREMADRLHKEYFAVKQSLFRAGIKPVSTESLYEPSAFEIVKNSPPPGRPKKTEAQEKTASKRRKPKP
jgi:hypothetical protein